MRVTLFVACFNDTFFPDVGRAVVRVLERLGHTVAFPLAQTCCGQMHHNTGYRHEATALMRRFAGVFGSADAIVCPSASCAGMVRDAYPELARHLGDPGLARAVEALAGRVHEFSAFLVDELGVTDVGAHFPHTVTYHPTCHSLRGLRLGDRPLRLLQAVHGLRLVDLPSADTCCGFGGTFAVKNADTSAAMLADKMRSVLDTGAEAVVAVDTSCLMHIGGGLLRLNAGVRTLHLAEVLAAEEGGRDA